MSAGQSPVSVLITAEHASNAVPEDLAWCFQRHSDVLQTHRAWDPGSGELAKQLARELSAPILSGKLTRLLVDLNRSIRHPRLFSEFSRKLSDDERHELVRQWHAPHWQAYRDHIDQPGRWLHIAWHSFTPVLEGVVRRSDIGLLYDPTRTQERNWCRSLIVSLRNRFSDLKVHANQPYRGTSNGLGQQHRRHFRSDKLITLEIEINTRLLGQPQWPAICRALVRTVVDQVT